jgi:hypothetical protein
VALDRRVRDLVELVVERVDQVGVELLAVHRGSQRSARA